MGLNHINVYYVALHRNRFEDPKPNQDIRYSLHLGTPGNETVYKHVSSDVPKGMDAWRYAQDHAGAPDATWLGKMHDCWGADFDALPAEFKDELHRYMADVKPPL